jgi:hypothetical protein
MEVVSVFVRACAPCAGVNRNASLSDIARKLSSISGEVITPALVREALLAQGVRHDKKHCGLSSLASGFRAVEKAKKTLAFS